jgi:hypothetical protein
VSKNNQDSKDTNLFIVFVRGITKHPRITIIASISLAILTTAVLISPSPGNTFAIIIFIVLASVCIAWPLYSLFIEGRISHKKSVLNYLGIPTSDTEIISRWIKQHRLLVWNLVIAIPLLGLIAFLAHENYITVARLSAVGFVLFSVITWRFYSIKEWLYRRQIYETRTRILGTVVDLNEIHGTTSSTDGDFRNIDEYRVEYAFSPIRGVILSEIRDIDGDFYSRLNIGKSITIVYDANNPTKSFPIGEDLSNSKQKFHRPSFQLNLGQVLAFVWNTLLIMFLFLAVMAIGFVSLFVPH